MKEYLKVKVCSLAAEIRIIKTQEQRTKERLSRSIAKVVAGKIKAEHETRAADYRRHNGHLFWGLRDHRAGLRHEARLSHLAYGFVREVPFVKMEATVHRNNVLKDADWDKIAAMVDKYDTRDKRDVRQKFAAFKAAGQTECKVVDEDERHIRNAKRLNAYHARPRRTMDEYISSKAGATD